MQHVLLILKLRWMLFRNSLRSKGGCSELVSAILLGLLLVPMDLVLSAFLGYVVYGLYGKDIFVPTVSCILAAITLAWQLIPLMTASLGSEANIERFRQYPLSTRQLFAVDLALGAFDPVALLAYPAVASVLAGALLRSPENLPLAVVSMAIFAAFNVILSRYMHRLISLLLSSRKRREVVAVLIFLILLSPQIILSLTSRDHPKSNYDHNADPVKTLGYTRKTLLTAGEYLAWLPPGLAARNLSATPESAEIGRWIALLAAAGFALGAASLEFTRLRADYYGSGSRAPRRSARKLGREPTGSKRVAQKVISGKDAEESQSLVTGFGLLEKILPWLPAASSAVLEKEIKYLYRSPRAFLIFIGPLVGTIIIIMPNGVGSIAAKAEHYRLAIIVLYSILLDTQFFSNAFGFDWHGAKLYFIAPIQGRSVLIGKNLAALTIMTSQTAAIFIIFRLFTSAVEPIALAYALFALAIAAPLSLALGNYLSIMYPRAVDFSKVYGRSYSHISQFAMLIELPVMAVVVGAGPVVALVLDSRSIGYAISGAEVLLASIVYVITLASAGRLMENRAEYFLQSLVARKE